MTQLLRTQLDADLESLIDTLPPHIRELLLERDDVNELLEVVLDLGREPEARFLSESLVISDSEIAGSGYRLCDRECQLVRRGQSCRHRAHAAQDFRYTQTAPAR